MSTHPATSRAGSSDDTFRYTMWSVFRLDVRFGDEDRSKAVAEVDDLFAGLADSDVVVRGTYDVSGLRADADVMIWWHSGSPDELQDAYQAFRRTELGERLAPVWSQLGVHRPAEFNKAHVPSFMTEPGGKTYLCVYPFVRSYDWYVLPEEERSDMLREHGMLARDYPDVRPNTVSAFALGDYEWLLAFEADELHRIVDLMRELRAARARLHVRDEIPFYTGRLRSVGDLVDALP